MELNELNKLLESRKDFFNKNEEDQAVGFMFDGLWITNPFFDECHRFEVDPIEYYGTKHIENLFEMKNKESMQELESEETV